ncbi:hypothetical protein MTR67_000492 [Solanum verrucosum]|uniref:Uncharacterized protein n=1 Tax=Solanum verrucosum TaxID=315347 RepID=A0AAF0PLX2_SOLVR|nr:hypothetical protein MTR67_000469 [Solanum verrucosum]WMV07107.1 hypothetical protein MTR67_000492 [Solanum verrucosum]
MVREKTNLPLQIRTKLPCAAVPTAQLPKGITHSYELGIEQTRRRWKDHSKGFLNITITTHKSS